jgi:ketosteroid isomerase-like protein
MNPSLRGASAIVVLAAAAGCAVTRAQAPKPEIPAGARRTIAKANADWLEAMKRQDAAAIAEPYDSAAVFVTATGESVRGRAGIEALMRERLVKSRRVTGGKIVQDGLVPVGSMIYEWGHANLDVALAGGGTGTLSGRYLTVWGKDSAGRWRIMRNLSLP